MEESRGLHLPQSRSLRKSEASSCECVAWQLAFKKKEAKVLNEKAMASRDNLTILSDYRRANDKETLERTNSK